MKPPPRWVRRLVVWPLPLLLVWLYVASVPLLLIAAFVVSYRLPGSLRAVRTLGLLTVYAFVEVAVIVVAFGLWIGSGFGWRLRADRFRSAHYRLLRWALRVLVAAGRRLFVLDIDVNGIIRTPDGPVVATTYDGPALRPVIVMSRHAGPADSILLMHELTTRFDRRPRIVLKADLQWDPAFDILLNRLPNRFVRHGQDSDATLRAIRELAEGMRPGDAFVIFPEGGNFTEQRRERSIRWFEEHDRHAEAERARAMQHVLPPRPGGTLAAFEGCPDAAAVFVAHVGLDEITGPRDLWRAIPDHKVLDMVFEVVPPEAVPAGTDDRVEMLWSEWEAIDAWIDGRPAGA